MKKGATAKANLATIWQKMQYHQMICEPYLTTSRGMTPYPVVTPAPAAPQLSTVITLIVQATG